MVVRLRPGLSMVIALLLTFSVVGGAILVITGVWPLNDHRSPERPDSPPEDQLNPEADRPETQGNEVAAANACGGAGTKRYGSVTEAQLPWAQDVPSKLKQLQATNDAPRLVAAFCTTLPDPILQEEYNIALAASRLKGAVIRGGEVFSLNNRAGPYDRSHGFRPGPSYQGGNIVPVIGGGVCKIASTMYNVVTLAGLPVVERHPHGMPVPYVPPGRDATIVYGVNDFRFKNTSARPLVIWSASQNGRLYIALYGSYKAPDVKWEQQVLSRQSAGTIRQYNPNLSPGQVRVEEEGADGVTVHTWVTVKWGSGAAVRQDRGIDSYRPMPRIIEYR